MITAKEARSIAEESHPYATTINPVKKAYVERIIRKAATLGWSEVSFSNNSIGDEWQQICAWLSSYGYSCWFDDKQTFWVGWKK